MNPRKPFAPTSEVELEAEARERHERTERQREARAAGDNPAAPPELETLGARMRGGFRSLARRGGHVVREVEAQFRERPVFVVAAAAGGGFLAGTFFGSRVFRMSVLVGLGYGFRSIFAPQEVSEMARRFVAKSTH
jgi:hypothetical protein